MTNQVIPEAAVDAAEEYLSLLMADPNGDYTMEARDLLLAAAPHMQVEATDDALRAAWDRGYAIAVEGMKDIPAQAWDEGARADHDFDGEVTVPNPYRSQS